MLPVPSPLFLHRTSAWKVAGVGDEQEEVRHPVNDGSSGFATARERRSVDRAAQATRGRCVAIHSPVHAAILRRELLGAERALYRRRARTAAPSRIGALRQARPRFTGGTAPVNLPDGAGPLKLPAQPLPCRNRSPELPRSRPPPWIAYK